METYRFLMPLLVELSCFGELACSKAPRRLRPSQHLATVASAVSGGLSRAEPVARLAVRGSGFLVAAASCAAADHFVPVDLPLKEARTAWTERFEEVYVRAVLEPAGGNVSQAARAAGVSRRFLQRMIARLGIGRKGLSDEEGDR